jgi:hypothetical protein
MTGCARVFCDRMWHGTADRPLRPDAKSVDPHTGIILCLTSWDRPPTSAHIRGSAASVPLKTATLPAVNAAVSAAVSVRG